MWVFYSNMPPIEQAVSPDVVIAITCMSGAALFWYAFIKCVSK